MIFGGWVIGLVGDASWRVPLLGTLHGWRIAFLMAALPGLLVALLTFSIREPTRRQSILAEDRTASSSRAFWHRPRAKAAPRDVPAGIRLPGLGVVRSTRLAAVAPDAGVSGRSDHDRLYPRSRDRHRQSAGRDCRRISVGPSSFERPDGWPAHRRPDRRPGGIGVFGTSVSLAMVLLFLALRPPFRQHCDGLAAATQGST